MEDNNPGQVVRPNQPPEPPTQPLAQQPAQPPQPLAQVASTPPAPIPPAVPQAPPQPAPQSTPEPLASAVPPVQPQPPAPLPTQPADQAPAFSADIPAEAYGDPAATEPASETVSWTASEFIAHHKSPAWYLGLTGLTITIAIAIYFLTGRDPVSAIVILIVAAIFGYYAAQQPKVQQYSLNSDGLSIGQKGYNLHDFKSFSIIDEGPFASITFMPLKRFMPAVSIFYDPQDEDKIVNILTRSLPLEMRRNDMIDRAMRRIRF